MSKQKVQQQFGANAAAYATSPVHAKGYSLTRLVELTQPQAEWQALDVATAAGHTAFAIAPHVAQVTATDLTPEMLTVAAGLAAEKELSNVRFEPAEEEAPLREARLRAVGGLRAHLAGLLGGQEHRRLPGRQLLDAELSGRWTGSPSTSAAAASDSARARS